MKPGNLTTKFARIAERCPHCRRPLYARPRVGPRITAMMPVVTSREPMAQVTIMCANANCGYGREDSIPLSKLPREPAPRRSWWQRIRSALFGSSGKS